MKRAVHVGGVILAVAAFAIGEIAKNTHWSWAGGVIALLTNFRTALMGLEGPPTPPPASMTP
jgi:uncharacterized membrane protein YccC